MARRPPVPAAMRLRATARAAAPALTLTLTLSSCIFGRDYQSVGDGRDGGALDDGGVLDGAWLDGAFDRDGSAWLDGSWPDGYLPDGRYVGGGGGGGNGSEDDGGDDELDVDSCAVTNAESHELTVPFIEGGFSLASGPTGFGIAYQRQSDCAQALDTLRSESVGPIGAATTILDDCRTMLDVALVSSSDEWHLAYTDNASNTVELRTMQLDDDLLPIAGEAGTTLTTNTSFERRPALADLDGSPFAAWISERDGKRGIYAQPLGAASAAPVVRSDAGHQPIELALSKIGPGAAIGWVEEVAERGIWLQPVEADGSPIDGPLQLTPFAAPGSSLSIAMRPFDGGAVVYSLGIDLANFEVRFRRLREDGSLRGDEIKVISQPLQAKDAGMARLGGGYVIAYRAIPDGNVITQSEIRLVFISKDGSLVRDAFGRVATYPVVPAAEEGSPIQVQVSVDGQLLLAFVDGSPGGDNTLRIVRRRLDCGF